MEQMPVLETERIFIRPFRMEDLEAAHQLFDVEIEAERLRTERLVRLEERRDWMNWSILNYAQLARLNQPPYGDRAIEHKSTGELIGSAGYVPTLSAFEQMPNLPYFREGPGRYTAEVGLFYAISPGHRRKAFAVEAAGALTCYAFEQLRLRRIIATTDYDNIASIGVIRKPGLTIGRNPLTEPPWLQVAGMIERV